MLPNMDLMLLAELVGLSLCGVCVREGEDDSRAQEKIEEENPPK